MKNKRLQIIAIWAFPVVLTIGIVLIPVVPDYTQHHLAEQAVDETARWYLGHIIAAVGFTLAILAVVAIDNHLQQTSRALPAQTLPLIAVGAGLYAAGLGADGVAPVAVRAAGYSPIIFFDGSGMFVTGLFIAGTVLFGLGLLNLVIGSIRLELLQGKSRYISFVFTLVFMIAPMILIGWALYGVALAAFGVFVPFALAIDSSK